MVPLTAAARVLPPIDKATLAPASLLPVMVLATSAALMMLSLATTLIESARGAAVSTMMARVLAALVLPLASVWVTLKVSAPWPMAVMSAGTSA